MTPATGAVHGRPPRPSGTGRVQPQRRVPAKNRRFDNGIPTWLILFGMFVGGLVSLLALNTASAASEVEQRSVVERNAEAADYEQQLVRDLAARQAPTALAQAATELGLVPNPNPAFLRINADGSVTVLGQPMPASVPVVPVVVPPTPTATPTTAKPTTAKPTTAAIPTTAATPATGARPTSTTKPTATMSLGLRPTTAATAAPPARPAPRPTSTGGHG